MGETWPKEDDRLWGLRIRYAEQSREVSLGPAILDHICLNSAMVKHEPTGKLSELCQEEGDLLHPFPRLQPRTRIRSVQTGYSRGGRQKQAVRDLAGSPVSPR